jgi:hypothetical protein
LRTINPYSLPCVKWALDLALGADGRIYCAGNHGRHQDGSDILIYDPASDRSESLRQALSLERYSVRNMVAVDRGRLIVTSLKALAKEEQGFLAVYDTQARKLLKHFQVAIAKVSEEIAAIPSDTLAPAARLPHVDSPC